MTIGVDATVGVHRYQKSFRAFLPVHTRTVHLSSPSVLRVAFKKMTDESDTTNNNLLLLLRCFIAMPVDLNMYVIHRNMSSEFYKPFVQHASSL
jgi:homogentisate 1,2-dioxygenase